MASVGKGQWGLWTLYHRLYEEHTVGKQDGYHNCYNCMFSRAQQSERPPAFHTSSDDLRTVCLRLHVGGDSLPYVGTVCCYTILHVSDCPPLSLHLNEAEPIAV